MVACHRLLMEEEMTREEKLIQAIEEEYERLPEISKFGDNNYKEQYLPLIDFIKTGKVLDVYPDEWSLYAEAVEGGLEYFYHDYGIE
jgi:hypothetical protein